MNSTQTPRSQETVTVTMTREQAQAALAALQDSRLGPAYPSVSACEAASALDEALAGGQPGQPMVEHAVAALRRIGAPRPASLISW